MSTNRRGRLFSRLLMRRSAADGHGLGLSRSNDLEIGKDLPVGEKVEHGLSTLSIDAELTHNMDIAEFETFTSSEELNHLISFLPMDKSKWEKALKMALALTEKSLGKSDEAGIDPALWKTTCTLLKANFYLQQSYPLERLRQEEWYQYSLHSAVGLLHPVCPERVVERLLVEFPTQTKVVEPASSRYPLHIAAATPFKLLSFSMTRAIVLDLLVQANSMIARVHDGQGNYPLELAKTSGYRFKLGLESLTAASQGPLLASTATAPPLLRAALIPAPRSCGNLSDAYRGKSVSSLGVMNETMSGHQPIMM